MQIVIDICESAYKEMCEYGTDRVDYDIQSMIKNGTVLPKHGRLGDLDYLYKKFESNGCKDSNVYRLIKDEPTILEAWGNEE